MTLLRGIERCKYISDALDRIDHLIWIKDENNNLVFANNAAFRFFESLKEEDDTIECPIKESEYKEDEQIKINIDRKEIWARFSSIPISDDSHSPSDKTLVIAKDITKQKNDKIEASKMLDEKISNWNKEKKEKARILDGYNQEIFDNLNTLKSQNGQI